MHQRTLQRARVGDHRAFRELTEPYRRELQVHCYRMLGSLSDAEDVVQETLLAAWRGLAGYQERASVRSWLYRIATNRCLNALRDAGRRVRTEPVPPFTPPEPTHRREITWLQPYPDALLDGVDTTPGPAARYEATEAVELAFIAALQRLAPRPGGHPRTPRRTRVRNRRGGRHARHQPRGGQPAFAAYLADRDAATASPADLIVLTMTGTVRI